MPRKKNNTLGSSYGPMEGVHAATKGHPRANSPTIRQHGLSAPERKERPKPHTYTVSEGVNMLAEKFFGAGKKKEPAKKGKSKTSKKGR